MKIGIDARFFGPRAKGIGRYVQKLIDGLAVSNKENNYVIFLRAENFQEFKEPNNHFKKVLADFRWYSFSEQLFFPWLLYRQKIDLMHFPHFNAPILYWRPFVVTVHDLILRRFGTARPGFFGRLRYAIKNLGYRFVLRIVLARAKKIITVSGFVKKEILETFKVKPEKISVIYEGSPVLSRKKAMGGENVLEKWGIKKPYLLYVGNAYPHKNLEKLAEAFVWLKQNYWPDLQLVLVGGEDYFYERLKRQNCDAQGNCFGGGVIFTGFVSDQELDILYGEARLYVFPSLYEGFGLPPLEAMSHGLPVVAAKTSALPEILGRAAIYFDATSRTDMADKIKQALEDKALREELIQLGFEQIKKYDWEKMAKETKKIYFE